MLRPSEGYDISVYTELVGGPFGGDESFLKAGERIDVYLPLYRDTLDRAHVLHLQQRFDIGAGIDDTNDLFLTERFYMGGSTLRGFDQRRAGPTQFGEPTGGEVRLLMRAEYNFPLVSTRRSGALRQSEILRGVVFTDFGMLGFRYDDLEEPRLSAGLGVRIQVPLLNVPIALDLGWPILSEDTDRQRQFFFSLARF